MICVIRWIRHVRQPWHATLCVCIGIRSRTLQTWLVGTFILDGMYHFYGSMIYGLDCGTSYILIDAYAIRNTVQRVCQTFIQNIQSVGTTRKSIIQNTMNICLNASNVIRICGHTITGICLILRQMPVIRVVSRV